MLTLFLLMTAVILISCVFSGSETGFVSLNPLKVTHAAAHGDFNARIAMRLMNSREQFLSSALVGNNVFNIAATLFFAALFTRVDDATALDLSRIPSPESWFLTPVMLLFSEILPKSLYRTYPFTLTMKSIPILVIFFYALTPVFLIFRAASKIVGRSKNALDSNAVREGIVQVATEGAKKGDIFESADNIMKNTLGLKGKCIADVMIPLDKYLSKNYIAFRASQFVGEFSAGGNVCADEVIVFDDAQTAPVGSVSLIDVAAGRTVGADAQMRTFASYVKPLPRLKAGMEVLPCLRRMPAGSRYYLVIDNDAPVGILDKTALYAMAFV